MRERDRVLENTQPSGESELGGRHKGDPGVGPVEIEEEYRTEKLSLTREDLKRCPEPRGIVSALR